MPLGRRGIVGSNGIYHGNGELVGSLTRLGQQAANSSVVAFLFPEQYRLVTSYLSEPALCDASLAKLNEAIARLEAAWEGIAR